MSKDPFESEERWLNRDEFSVTLAAGAPEFPGPGISNVGLNS